jgi:hypothetical protein
MAASTDMRRRETQPVRGRHPDGVHPAAAAHPADAWHRDLSSAAHRAMSRSNPGRSAVGCADSPVADQPPVLVPDLLELVRDTLMSMWPGMSAQGWASDFAGPAAGPARRQAHRPHTRI